MKSSTFKQNVFYRAYLWDPENPEKKSPCTISKKNGEPIKIECWENLQIFKRSFRDLNFHEPIKYMFGELENGKDFTIYNIRLESSRTGNGISRIGIICEVLLIGGKINPDEEIIKLLSLKNQYLENWADLKPISIKNNRKEGLNLNVNIDPMKEVVLFKSNETQISLDFFINFPLQKVNNLFINPIPRVYFSYQKNISITDAINNRECFKLLFQLILNV